MFHDINIIIYIVLCGITLNKFFKDLAKYNFFMYQQPQIFIFL